ncbi:MAG: hypothetical protein AB7O96_19485, partial [Pseudobdellovibrionaceae bacterium]
MRMLVVSFLIFSFLQAEAGFKAGNGGSGWSCVENLGSGREKIIWLELMDLYEAKEIHALKLTDYKNESHMEIASHVLSQVQKIDFKFAGEVENNLSRVLKYRRFTNEELTVIPDTFEGLYPEAPKCPTGSIKQRQIANWKNDDDRDGSLVVLFSQKLFYSEQFSETERAAVLVHEAIYASLRTLYADQDSIRTRRIVGLLFSDQSMRY